MGILGIVHVAWKAKEWSRNDAHSGVWEAEAMGKVRGKILGAGPGTNSLAPPASVPRFHLKWSC